MSSDSANQPATGSSNEADTTQPTGESKLDNALDTAKRIAISIVGLLVFGLIAAALLPRWWSRQLGNMVGERNSTGVLVGLTFGVVCTLVPLLLLWLAFRGRSKEKKPWWLVVVAFVVALPNLFTLWLVVGTGDSATAGRRVLDVDAPGVRFGTLIGVVLAVLAFGGILYLVVSRARARKGERAAQEKANTGSPQ
jgi:RsiW-degrading membrane proteinase PrsW (M82 family)